MTTYENQNVNEEENLAKVISFVKMKFDVNLSNLVVCSDSFMNDNCMKDFHDDLEQFPEIKSYIKKLQECVHEQNIRLDLLISLIKENKLVLRSLDSFTETSTQTDFHEDEKTSETLTSVSPWITESSQINSTSLAEQVKEAAEQALKNTNFVYEETSGMYYDYSTGYYYNAELGLYYDGNSGAYYYYDNESRTLQFHSQPESTYAEDNAFLDNIKRGFDGGCPQRDTKQIKLSDKNEDIEDSTEKVKDDANEALEDGECSVSSENDENEDTICSSSLQDDDSAKAYPPCMRIIVNETNLDKLKVGSLFIVTYIGGTLGREGDHAVQIPDINISKHHAKFIFQDDKYHVIDYGSRNGTFLNGNRLSVAKCESDPHEIVHGSILQVGGTKLLCHIHLGRETCGHCEPGLLQQPDTDKTELCTNDTKRSHKSELKRLQRKFCLDKPIPSPEASEGKYQDRAEMRRSAVGSSSGNEKTESTSVHVPISSENKGFKLLSKMGWSEGKALGKESTGLMEPVPLEGTQGKTGLGADPVPEEISLSRSDKKKIDRWKKAQQRYDSLS